MSGSFGDVSKEITNVGLDTLTFLVKSVETGNRSSCLRFLDNLEVYLVRFRSFDKSIFLFVWILRNFLFGTFTDFYL